MAESGKGKATGLWVGACIAVMAVVWFALRSCSV